MSRLPWVPESRVTIVLRCCGVHAVAHFAIEVPRISMIASTHGRRGEIVFAPSPAYAALAAPHASGRARFCDTPSASIPPSLTGRVEPLISSHSNRTNAYVERTATPAKRVTSGL